MADESTQALTQTVLAAYPWLANMPTLVDSILRWAEEGQGAAEIYGSLTQTPEYKARFPAIRDNTGQKRMDESAYIRREQEYRTVMIRHGDAAYNYDEPSDFAAFMENGMEPDELNSRFQMYETLDQYGSEVKAAFYIYAGVNLTTDDLYQAVVDPTFRQNLQTQYTVRTALSSPDYETWLNRTTEMVLSDVATKLAQYEATGSIPPATVTELANMQRETAKGWVAAMYAAPEATTALSFTDVAEAFNYALIGGAAIEYGVEAPPPEVIGQWVGKGVDRAKALTAFGTIATQGAFISGLVSRAGLDPSTLNLSEALLEGVNASQAAVVNTAAQAAEATANVRGSANFAQGRQGELEQSGLGLDQ